ncbi:MAG: tripartite tricarboxylate transporter substrate binding protein [Variovorax sp.]|nr:MAG: tripartite tricarboxylate transporter substrate binding protein [Variovorax sp.]
MNTTRSMAAAVGLAIAAGSLLPITALAEFPDKPIRIVVPYAPGGGSDTLARQLAERLRPRLGQPILIDNKVGANGIIGTDFVAKSPADGYTYVWVVGSHYINPLVTPKMPYHALNDFTGVTTVAVSPSVLVLKSDFPPSSVPELVALMRQRDGRTWSYGSSESSSRLSGAKLMKSQDIEAVHIAYKGGAEVVAAIASGTVTTGFVSVATARQLIVGGRLKALAVTGDKRAPSLPDVQTFAESGIKGFDQATTTFMLLAPRNTPPVVLDRMQKEVAGVLHEPEMQAVLATVDAIGVGNSLADFSKQMVRDFDYWTRAGQDAGLKVE